MLVLNRQLGQSIELSGGLVVTLVAIAIRPDPAAVLEMRGGLEFVKEGSAVRISGNRIVVTEVVSCTNVRIGIEAPPEILIFRSEVIDQAVEPFSHYSPEFIAARTRIPLEMVERRVTCTNTKD